MILSKTALNTDTYWLYYTGKMNAKSNLRWQEKMSCQTLTIMNEPAISPPLPTSSNIFSLSCAQARELLCCIMALYVVPRLLDLPDVRKLAEYPVK